MAEGCAVGIDPGERWIGVARAAKGSSLALPLGTLDRRHGDEAVTAALRALLAGDHATTLVIGAPLRPDGTEDAQAVAFRRFGESLAASLGARCVAQDERFSSGQLFSDRLLQQPRRQRVGGKARAAGRKSVQRQRRERERSHADAAAQILQRWLDARDHSRARSGRAIRS